MIDLGDRNSWYCSQVIDVLKATDKKLKSICLWGFCDS
jgi:hypothetical protein